MRLTEVSVFKAACIAQSADDLILCLRSRQLIVLASTQQHVQHVYKVATHYQHKMLLCALEWPLA